MSALTFFILIHAVTSPNNISGQLSSTILRIDFYIASALKISLQIHTIIDKTVQ